MNTSKPSDYYVKIMLRAGAGLLALVALGLAILRAYALFVVGVEGSAGPIINILRILFPLSLAVLFAYVAIRGRLF